MEKGSTANAKTIGIVFLVAAAILGGIFIATRSDHVGTPFCALSTASLSSLTVAAHQERSTTAILATVGLPLACTAFVDAVSEDDPVKTDVALPNGETKTYEVSGSELVETPPAPSRELDLDFHRMIECVQWNNDLLYRMCGDGTIGPPVGAAF